ncbi:MAG: hypothetical protein C4518_15060 [Desulfobacteraceae bacterium]|nr:MAG: hypothetical protein C4518_15060 [Desulfobacteraceae bacterium]
MIHKARRMVSGVNGLNQKGRGSRYTPWAHAGKCAKATFMMIFRLLYFPKMKKINLSFYGGSMA